MFKTWVSIGVALLLISSPQYSSAEDFPLSMLCPGAEAQPPQDQPPNSTLPPEEFPPVDEPVQTPPPVSVLPESPVDENPENSDECCGCPNSTECIPEEEKCYYPELDEERCPVYGLDDAITAECGVIRTRWHMSGKDCGKPNLDGVCPLESGPTTVEGCKACWSWVMSPLTKIWNQQWSCLSKGFDVAPVRCVKRKQPGVDGFSFTSQNCKLKESGECTGACAVDFYDSKKNCELSDSWVDPGACRRTQQPAFFAATISDLDQNSSVVVQMLVAAGYSQEQTEAYLNNSFEALAGHEVPACEVSAPEPVGCDGISGSGWDYNSCGICAAAGDESGCEIPSVDEPVGCDGISGSNWEYNSCGICAAPGDESNCETPSAEAPSGCDGVSGSGWEYNSCGICAAAGDESGCEIPSVEEPVGCDGFSGSNWDYNSCGVCAAPGDESACQWSADPPPAETWDY